MTPDGVRNYLNGTLPARACSVQEAALLRCRYDVTRGVVMPLTEVGRHFGMTGEGVRTKIQKIIARLTSPEALDHYLSGPCQGHACDHCDTCQAGHCCRGDNPSYRLPALGAWLSPLCAPLGQLTMTYEAVICHICGGTYKSLIGHIWIKHDLTADEYKAICGLNRETGLVHASVSEALSVSAVARGIGPQRLARMQEALRGLTLEQYEALQETRVRPRLEAKRAISQARGGQGTFQCVHCGRLAHSYHYKKRVTCSRSCQRAHLRCVTKERLADPVFFQMRRHAQHVSDETHGRGRSEAQCEVCGVPMVTRRRRPRRTCSVPCLRVLQSTLAQSQGLGITIRYRGPYHIERP